jgi:transposase
VKSRLAIGLRIGPNSLHHAKNFLGEFFRRIVRKLGKAQAITATAHKLSRIVYQMLVTKELYREEVFKRNEEEELRRAASRLQRQAAQLGFTITPAVTA